LKKGVKYYYMVSAYGEKGTRIASYMTSEYGTQAASGKPAVIIYGVKVAAKVKNNKKGTVTVSYNKVTGAKTYQIYRAEKKNGKYTLIGTTKKTSFADKKAKKKKTYYYKVVVNGRNELLADFTIRSSAVKIKVKK
jgi:NADPH:quinone reductase-like Zn-dependent oxidoreductase